MPALQLIFNELSIGSPAPSVYEARRWLENLHSTLARAIECGNLANGLLVPQAFFSTPLTQGYTFFEWIDDQAVELDLRLRLQDLLSWGPYADDFFLNECADCIEVTHNGATGIGVTLAVHRDHAVTSVDVHPFQDELLRVRARRQAVEEDTYVCNFYGPDVVDRRLLWLAERTIVKPEYKHARHHDRSSGEFRGGGGMTSEIPEDAREVYAKARSADPTNPRAKWWGQTADGYLYRYAVSVEENRLFAHWNGTTEESNARRIEDREVPARIRQIFPDRRY